MRVISGSARGIKLESVEGENTRPTLDRVKEAVFSMIMPYICGSNILDLFGGSGALGIEALSRGAQKCTFVEKSNKCKTVIEKNLQKTKLSSCGNILLTDYKNYLENCKEKYDLVFLDPPYVMWENQEILKNIFHADILNTNGIIVAEAENKTSLTTDCFNLKKHKKYGRVGIWLFERI